MHSKIASAARDFVEKVANTDVKTAHPNSPLTKVAHQIQDDCANAFDHGFMKAAADYGLSREDALSAYNILCQRVKAEG